MATIDYQVLSFQDSAPLTEVGMFSADPYTLDLKGKYFKAVSEVLINGIRSPEFIVLSPTRLLAEVPRRLRRSRIVSVSVLLSRRGLTETSRISMRAVVPGARASGFTRLMQMFLKILFTNPGSDIQNPTMGGGMGQLVGATGDPGSLRAQAAIAVRTAEQDLTAVQTKNTGLSDSERLKSATLLSADFNAATTGVSVKLRITAMDGSTHEPVVSV